jgi:hypothetical protein
MSAEDLGFPACHPNRSCLTTNRAPLESRVAFVPSS